MSVQDTFEFDEYADVCAICGTSQVFKRTKSAVRETYSCEICRGSLREREHAKTLVSFYGRGEATALAQLCNNGALSGLSIYEPGTTGAIRKYLKPLPFYHQSDYYPPDSRDRADTSIPHQSLEALSYADGSFDLVISSDILEHVRRPTDAFKEIYRVLRSGGVNCFTVPLQHPLMKTGRARVDTSGSEDIYLLPPHYHGDGKGGRSLVYTDFGEDVIAMLQAVGFVAGLVTSRASSRFASKCVTVFSIKL